MLFDVYVPLRSGFGAGTKDPRGRANALRIILAEAISSEHDDTRDLVLLATDLDDMSPEHAADAAEMLRVAGALDVVCLPTIMKKGRAGTRIEVLASTTDAARLEDALFAQTTTLGIRRTRVERRALPREMRTVRVLGHDVRVKVASLPDGRTRSKPEYEDIREVARATGRSVTDVTSLAYSATERG